MLVIPYFRRFQAVFTPLLSLSFSVFSSVSDKEVGAIFIC